MESSESDSSQPESCESNEEEDLTDEAQLSEGSMFINESVLRRGPHSEITLGENPSNGKLYVTKWIFNKDAFEREYKNLQILNHSRVAKLLGVQLREIDECRGLIFQFVRHGTLQTLIEKHRKLTSTVCQPLFRTALDAIVYIHSIGMIHRDIKPENFLRSGRNSVKLIDFGLSQMEPADGCYGTQATPSFLAPECITSNGGLYSGKKADVWALGMTLVNLLTGEVLYDGLNKYEVMEDIRDRPIELRKCKLLEELDENVMNVIEKMLNRDPMQRCSAIEATQLPWLRNE